MKKIKDISFNTSHSSNYAVMSIIFISTMITPWGNL